MIPFFSQETAGNCLAILRKHGGRVDKLERLRLTPAERARLVRDGMLGEPVPVDRPPAARTNGRPRSAGPGRAALAAEEYLALPPEERHGAQRTLAVKYGIQPPAVSAAVMRLRARRAAGKEAA